MLYHFGDPARRIEATANSRLPTFDDALSCVVYSHLDWRRECTPTLMQGTCAYRVNTDGAKRHRSGHDRREAGLHDRSWRTGSRFQWWSLGEPTLTGFGRSEDGRQDDRLAGGLGTGCGDCGRTTGSGSRSVFGGRIVAHTDTRRKASACVTEVAAGTNACVE